jgi:TonB-dependent receptor
MKKLLLPILFILSFQAIAQKGIIRGSAYDAANGDALIGVTVVPKGTTTGAVTDLDGKFSISVDAGTYNLEVSYISFQSITIEGVVVKAGEVTIVNNIQLKQATIEVGEVVVKAEMVRKNESSMLMMKQKSAVMVDGISSEKMELIGDGNAVEAAKRVTGVSVEGGKYVYVRGLGDRYSKTTLNGMDIPGLDPDRNSLQMDIFPTNLIDNIMVSKNFTAEMPADFTGGLMNVETKDFPDARILNLSFGVGYNPFMHFNPEYLSYKGGKTDFLGFDDGTRALPAQASSSFIPTPTSGANSTQVRNFVQSFNPTLGASQGLSLMDFSGSFTYGNQFGLKKDESGTKKLGFIFSLSYKTDYKYYDDVRYGEYQRYSNPSETEMRYATVQTGRLGERSTLLGAILGLAYKTDLTKIKFNVMHLQSGESRAAKFTIDNDGAAVGQSGYLAYSDNLEYNQRSMTNALLSGTHVMAGAKWELDWRVSPTFSISDDPDIRKTAFTVTPTNTFFSSGAGGNPSRIWRSLQEINLPVKADVTYNYRFRERESKLNFGASHIYKQREYEILFYDIQFFGNQSWSDPDPNTVLDPENLYPSQPNSIYYQSGNNDPNPNQYESNINNSGLYVSNEMELFKHFKTIVGVRMEYYVQRHTGRDQTYASGDIINGKNLDNDKVLETINFFPSVNLIYSVSDKQNIRLAYSRTVARPSFKELSFAQIIDPITNRIFNGSLFSYTNSSGVTSWDGNLKETDIDNLDLRWEYFLKGGQMFSVSGFFKHFANPIELVRIPEQQTSAEFQTRNVGTGYVFGLELEARKNLDFIAPALADLSINANVTIAQSLLTMSQVEFDARKSYERTGENISNIRRMAGQSPYVVNAGISYGNREIGLDVGIFYNMKGPTLEIVGIGLSPDVYTEPFHSLNFSINKKLGKNQRTVIDLKVANMLNDRVESVYRSYNADKQVFSSRNPGVSIGLGVSHKF